MDEYYYNKGTQRLGPVDLAKLQELYDNGEINYTTLVWKAGMTNWQPLGTVLRTCPLPPSGGPMPTNPTKPNNHMVMAIIVTLFCCLPLGIVGIIKAGSVDPLWNAGLYNEAVAAAESAHKWNMIGLIAGIIFQVLFGVGFVGGLNI